MTTPDRVPMTPQGYEKLKKEIDQLKSVERPKILQELEEARAHGDLSENAEYHAAKERLGHVKGRMLDLELRLSRAEIIDPKKMGGHTRVVFGAHVTLLDLEQDVEITYQIVGDHESDIAQGKISVSSPIARSIIGKNKQDAVKVKTPKGIKEFEILAIEYK
ncbi:MAG: transcription elongation factor GreA [Deltaproteobacteria bacterium]|nr:transcription elongation factor GreA [Deltaproteobacteria bacterium]